MPNPTEPIQYTIQLFGIAVLPKYRCAHTTIQQCINGAEQPRAKTCSRSTYYNSSIGNLICWQSRFTRSLHTQFINTDRRSSLYPLSAMTPRDTFSRFICRLQNRSDTSPMLGKFMQQNLRSPCLIIK